MYGFGWRKRIGCISPSVMEMISFDFYRFAPDGVGFVGVTEQTNSWSPEDIDKTLKGSLENAAYLGDRGCDFIVHTGAAHVASKGPGYDVGYLAEMTKRAGAPATTSVRSALNAFKRMGMKRIAIASPWPEKIVTWVADYMRAEGIEVAHVGFAGVDFKVLHTLQPIQVYQFAMGVANAAHDIDGLYMPGPQAPAAMTVPFIERDIHKPVIASTPADFWAAFHALGIRDHIEGHGRLLASLAQD